jgi:multidrug efflux pump subunit AcrA (membrane-fusion protein)
MPRFVVTALCLLLTLTAAAAHGGDDHDHAEEAAATAGANAAPQLEIADENVELVAEIADRKLRIYLDRSATNAPIDGATIDLTVDDIPAGAATAQGDGKYELAAPWADEPGTKKLKFAVKVGDQKSDLAGDLVIAHAGGATPQTAAGWLTLLYSVPPWLIAGIAAVVGFILAMVLRPRRALAIALIAAGALAAGIGGVRAHEGDDHAEDEAPASAQVAAATPRRLPDGDVWLPKSTQRLLQVRTQVGKLESARQSRELIGTVVPDPSSFGQVQAPMDGRIELAERGISNVGQHVEAGEILAYLSPNIPIADLGTMQQLTAEVAGKLKIAEQKLARLTRIASVVAQKDIEDTRAEMEALREQQRVLALKDVERIPLKAPVAGVISVANVRAGQVVTTRDTLFEIVDPHRLWIEAISGLAHHSAPDIAAAYAMDADGHSIPLSYIGRAPSLRQQTQPTQFKVEERHEGLMIGSAVKVFVQQGDLKEGIVVPGDAVVRGSEGLPRVWVKESPQLFRPMPVRVVPLDGVNVLLVGGVPAGSRIVVEGAELINQVR